MDVSSLKVEVVSTGIKETSDALGGLSRSAGNAEKKVVSLTEKLGLLSQKNTITSLTTGNLNTLLGQVALHLAAAANASNSMVQALNHATRGMAQLGQTTQSTNAALQRKSIYGGVVTTTLKAMATAAMTYFSIGAARNIVEQADAWTMMAARLKIVTGTMEEAKTAQSALFEMAQKLRVPLEDLGRLYTRLTPALGRMGKTAQQTRDMVEGVALALKLGGATGAEAASVMLQFSQAANAGRLNGQEFNAVAENGVLILRALEDTLGKNQAELKKMGADGKLTFDLISDAINKQLPKWRQDFETIPLTFEGAMQRVKNAWFKAVGEIGEGSQLGQKMAESVLKLEEMIPKVVTALVNGIVFVVDNAKTLMTVFNTIVAITAAKWALEAAASFVTLSRSIGLVAIATSAVGGPLGIIAGLLAAGATAWMLWSNDAKNASEDVTTKTTIDIDKRVKELNKEILKLQERNKIVRDGKPEETPAGRPLSGATQQILDQIGALEKAKEKASAATQAMLQVEIDKLHNQFKLVMGLELAVEHQQQMLSDADRLKKVTELTAAAMKSFGTPLERANMEIQEWTDKFKAIGAEIPKDLVDRIREKYLKTEAKAETEAQKARRAAVEELTRQNKLYTEQEQTLLRMKATRQHDEKLTTIDREILELQEKINKEKDGEAKFYLVAALNRAKAAKEVENERLQLQELLKSQEDYTKDLETAALAAERDAKAMQDRLASYGLAKGVIEDFTLSEAKLTLIMLQNSDATDRQISAQTRIVEALQRTADAKAKLGQMETLDEFTKLINSDKVASFGDAMGGAFGKIGKAIDKAGKGFDNFNKKLNQLDKARKEALKITDEETRAKAVNAIRAGQVEAEISMYGDMAGAAKGFFNEKTVAYKAFDAFESGLRIAQIALTWQKTTAEVAATQAALAAKTTAAGVAVTVDNVETGNSIRNSIARAGASTTAGVAKAFEQLGVWGFVGAGAIIAFMASMGVKKGGGASGPSLTEKRQKEQGTGTVLGNDEAKSKSILGALEKVRDNSNIGLEYSANMVASLRNIEMSLGGFTRLVASNGLATAGSFGITPGESRGKGLFGSGLFGSKTSTNVLDTGLMLNGRIGDFLAGGGVNQYADVQTTTKKWYGKSKTHTSRQIESAGEDAAKALGSIFANISNTIVESVAQLGGSAGIVQEYLNNFGINLQVSLKDLKGDDLKAAIEAVISSTADRMATAAFSGLQRFQQVGEGYYETLVRVASGSEIATDALDKLGVQAISWQQLQQTGGDVATEMVRESLMAKESGTSLNNILRLLDGSMNEIIQSYKILTRLRNSMEISGLGTNLSLALIRGAGGIGELESAFDTFFDKFYTDAEKQNMAMSRLQMEFAKFGRAVPASREEFRALVTAMVAGGEATHETAGKLLALSGTFDEAMALLDAAAERKRQEEDKQLKRIQDAKDALREAYDREAQALETVRDKMRGFADSLKEFRQSLTMGDMSTASEMEKYQTALIRYNEISAAALAGDESAIEKFQSVATELLKFSRSVNASGEGYTADFERVMRESEAVQQYAELQADMATQSLEQLKTQVGLLIDLNDTMLTVAQAIANLQIVMAGGVIPDGSHANGLANVPYDGYLAELHKGERVLTASENAEYTKIDLAQYGRKTDEALVAEIKALREEVRTLKEEQREHTAALISSNYDANEQNAQAIVAGSKEVAEDVAYATRNQLGLN
jgi:trimeric autotransporter adhesin